MSQREIPSAVPCGSALSFVSYVTTQRLGLPDRAMRGRRRPRRRSLSWRRSTWRTTVCRRCWRSGWRAFGGCSSPWLRCRYWAPSTARTACRSTRCRRLYGCASGRPSPLCSTCQKRRATSAWKHFWGTLCVWLRCCSWMLLTAQVACLARSAATGAAEALFNPTPVCVQLQMIGGSSRAEDSSIPPALAFLVKYRRPNMFSMWA